MDKTAGKVLTEGKKADLTPKGRSKSPNPIVEVGSAAIKACATVYDGISQAVGIICMRVIGNLISATREECSCRTGGAQIRKGNRKIDLGRNGNWQKLDEYEAKRSISE